MRRSIYTPTKEMLADSKFTAFLDELVRKAEENNVDIRGESFHHMS